MRYQERDDTELLELAQAGWPPAFAVLVHRYGPALLAAFARDPDPVDRTTDVFVRAMRQLHEGRARPPVDAWLFALAGEPRPATVPEVDAATLDAIWHELDPRWPDGRHVHHHQPRPVRRVVATVVGAIALGVAVPTVVLGLPASGGDEVVTVRAQPLEEVPEPEPETEELPDFEFPDIGDGEPPPSEGPAAPEAPEPDTEPTTSTPSTPSPPPPPPPPPPAPEPEPELDPIDDGTGEDRSGDDGSDDDGSGDDGSDDDDGGGEDADADDDGILPGVDRDGS